MKKLTAILIIVAICFSAIQVFALTEEQKAEQRRQQRAAQRAYEASARTHDEVARQAAEIQLESGTMEDFRFYLSDIVGNFAEIAQRFLGEPITNVAFVDQTDLPWYER